MRLLIKDHKKVNIDRSLQPKKPINLTSHYFDPVFVKGWISEADFTNPDIGYFFRVRILSLTP